MFGYRTDVPWEFQSKDPIRSTLPVLLLALPVFLLNFTLFSATHVYYISRLWQCALSFLIGRQHCQMHLLIIDFCVYQIAPRSSRESKLLLLASSYTMWTYATHSFSNSSETILVCAAMYLAQRVLQRRGYALSSLLAYAAVCVHGVFTRITFPAFVLFPTLLLIPSAVTRKVSSFAPR